MTPISTLLVTEVELYIAVEHGQDMLFAMLNVLLNIAIEAKLPLILEGGNKGAVDLCNNWCIEGRTRHIEVKQSLLKKLKEVAGYY